MGKPRNPQEYYINNKILRKETLLEALECFHISSEILFVYQIEMPTNRVKLEFFGYRWNFISSVPWNESVPEPSWIESDERFFLLLKLNKKIFKLVTTFPKFPLRQQPYASLLFIYLNIVFLPKNFTNQFPKSFVKFSSFSLHFQSLPIENDFSLKPETSVDEILIKKFLFISFFVIKANKKSANNYTEYED